MAQIDVRTALGVTFMAIGLGWLAFGGASSEAPPSDNSLVVQAPAQQDWGPGFVPGAQPQAPVSGPEAPSAGQPLTDPPRVTPGAPANPSSGPVLDPYAG